MFLVLAGIVVFQAILPGLREETFGYSWEPERGLVVRDFAAGLVMTKAIWQGRPKPEGSPRPGPGYDLDSHLAVTRQWVGRPVEAAMPFPQSPTMLWLWAPLCPLPLAWAYAVLTVVNLAAVWWMLRPGRSPWLAGPLLFLSPVSIVGFAYGQMAFRGAAAIVFLMEQTARPDAGSWRRLIPCVLVLWALTSRPPLALTAGTALLALGHWRCVLGAAVLTAVSTAALTPWLGTGWPADYLRLLGQFNREQMPAAFAWVLEPEQMSNLRAFLHLELGLRDDLASRLSSIFWLIALGAVLIVSRLRRLPRPLVWAVSMVLEMLLCPHMNSYMLVLLYPVLLCFVRLEGLPEKVRRAGAWVFPALLWLSPGGPLQGRRPSLFFAALVVLAGIFAWLTVRHAARLRQPWRLLPGQARS
jgi:hypothetical protein